VAAVPEDAAAEGGEAIATFAGYCAPDWVSNYANLFAANSGNVLAQHTSPACESALLASVSAPLPPPGALEVLVTASLSKLQLEGCSLAIARHQRLFVSKNSKVRAGFFVGDGAGIGKGRQIAAIIKDSFCRSTKGEGGRGRRHLWLSVSRELVEDARRDLTDVGCFATVHDAAEGKTGGNKAMSGVMFSTYALLISGKGKRMEDFIAWLTGSIGKNDPAAEEKRLRFDGCIVFDEAHKAKNLYQDPPTATGKLVLGLQDRLPNARVVYASATGVSDLKQMGYAVRLGLWGPGSPFPTFEKFKTTLERRGVGAMEMLALEMKQVRRL
jgi:hypothetical protein